MSSGGAGGARQRARLTALIRGRVQMVGFRIFAEQAVAQIERGENTEITGWVRNLPDGASVEVVAEGERAALELLLAELQIGPPSAIVREAQPTWSKASNDLEPFALRY